MLGLGFDLNKTVTSLPRKTTFNKYRIKTTRAGLSGNPVQRYSFTSGDTFTNNVLATHGDSFFVGGDTATYEFDFGLKVAGSVVECPMKVFRINNTVIQAPTGTWVEWGSADQSTIDTYKTIGGASSGTNSTVNGNIAQIMVELDLTSLCNTMFGGSNATLKSALKAINVDAWAQGSGANGGVLTNGCKMQIWNEPGTVWALMKSGTLGTIEKLTGSAITSDYITATNKIFILLNTTYSSNGVIMGAIQLDYINIKIDLARVPDVVTPINVNLPRYWAMVVKGWSPSFDNAISTTGLQYIASLYKDTNNFIQLYYNEVSDKFHLEKKIGGASTVVMFGGVETFLKFQSYSFVFGQSTAGMFLNILKNNNIAYYYKNVDTQTTNSIFNFYPQRWNTTYYANSFAESFHLLDLERIGKSAGLSDAEAVSILKGQMHIKENNLVVNGDFSQDTTGWSGVYSSMTVTNNTLNVIQTNELNVYGRVQQIINAPYVLNNKYYVNARLLVTNSLCTQIRVGLGNNPATLYEFYNKNTPVENIWHSMSNIFVGKGTDSDILIMIDDVYADGATANGKTMQVQQVQCINLTALFGAGLEPTLAQCDAIFTQNTTNPIAIANPELFDVNKVTLHANATRSNGIITLNATASTQISKIIIPVLPNNRYELNCVHNGNVYADYKYNNSLLGYTAFVTSSTPLTFTPPNNCNNLVVMFYSTTAGTFTFSNISLKRKD